jgi:hypothetical protein
MSIGDRMKKEVDGLRRLRDELRVQAQLGKAELRESFEGLEKRWQQLEGKLEVMGKQAREDADEVKKAADVLVRELREGYKHLKARL